MSEYLEVLTEDGAETGIKKERDAVHHDGDWHLSIHVWVISGNDVLLQKRSIKKESYPGCYDVSASGHVSFGEHVRVAASRELYEETGITVDPLDFDKITVRQLIIEDASHGFISREYNYVFAVYYTADHPEIKISEPDAIDELTWINMDALGERLRIGEKNYCIPLEEWNAVKKFRG